MSGGKYSVGRAGRRGSAARRRPGEDRLVAAFAKAFASDSKHVLRSIGDDAAVLSVPSPLVWTVDDSVEDVHFRRDWMDLGAAAARAFEAALSDIAAMGARPLAALCSWQVAFDATTADLSRVRRALVRSAKRATCPIVGGNVTRAAVWRFTTTLLGHVRVPVLRSSARPGHRLWLSGDLGLAACGRAWLAQGSRLPARRALRDAVRVCVTAFRAPEARISEGCALDGRCQAAIDVSDGLAAECRRLADASGVRVVIDESRLRAVLRPELTLAAAALGLDPLALALYGGEDYALLISGPSRRRPLGACPIGEVVEGKEARLRRGARLLRISSGYDHLA